MRVCVVGHFVASPDEGVRRIATRIADELSKRHEVLTAGIDDIRSWRGAKRFAPDIIHFVLSPSNVGLLVAKLLACYCNGARTVMSAPHADQIWWGKFGRLLRPDVTLVQSRESEEMFQKLEYRTLFFPNGVDCERFRPVSARDKERLRDEYGIPREAFVILHVGPVKGARNVRCLADMQEDNNNQVLIVGRPSEPGDRKVREQLEKMGCMVWLDYLPRLEDIYALSDCYIFPTPPAHKRSSIEIPLSVLEAMACDLAVITTRFGALPRAFEEGDGFFFVDSEHDLIRQLETVKGGVRIRTRRKVLACSWAEIVQRLEDIYDGLLEGAGA